MSYFYPSVRSSCQYYLPSAKVNMWFPWFYHFVIESYHLFFSFFCTFSKKCKKCLTEWFTNTPPTPTQCLIFTPLSDDHVTTSTSAKVNIWFEYVIFLVLSSLSCDFPGYDFKCIFFKTVQIKAFIVNPQFQCNLYRPFWV